MLEIDLGIQADGNEQTRLCPRHPGAFSRGRKWLSREATMKTTGKITEAIVSAEPESSLGHSNVTLLPSKERQSRIQWATEQQIQEVSKQLTKINQVAIRSEADGDYFKSGDLAYQVREIIRATADLFKKSQRTKG